MITRSDFDELIHRPFPNPQLTQGEASLLVTDTRLLCSRCSKEMLLHMVSILGAPFLSDPQRFVWGTVFNYVLERMS